jgi:hypothetical protein
MPIDLSRTEDAIEQINRLSYSDGVDIKESAYEFLYINPTRMFSADEISARISESAAPAQIETVLSNHPDLFRYEKHNTRLYWTVDENK